MKLTLQDHSNSYHNTLLRLYDRPDYLMELSRTILPLKWYVKNSPCDKKFSRYENIKVISLKIREMDSYS